MRDVEEDEFEAKRGRIDNRRARKAIGYISGRSARRREGRRDG